jgi:hypothetical protein
MKWDLECMRGVCMCMCVCWNHTCNAGPRSATCWGERVDIAQVWYFVSGFWRELQKFRNFLRAFGRNDREDPYLLAVASRPRAILFSACPVSEGGGVHVVSYMLILHRSGQGGCCTYLAPPPRLQVWLELLFLSGARTKGCSSDVSPRRDRYHFH